jgi:hypothetical protein
MTIRSRQVPGYLLLLGWFHWSGVVEAVSHSDGLYQRVLPEDGKGTVAAL